MDESNLIDLESNKIIQSNSNDILVKPNDCDNCDTMNSNSSGSENSLHNNLNKRNEIKIHAINLENLNSELNNDMTNFDTSEIAQYQSYNSSDSNTICESYNNESILNGSESFKLNTNIKFIGLLLFYGLYLVVGGIGFHIIETPVELKIKNDLKIEKDNFLVKYPQLQDNDLEEFLTAVLKANDRGISILRNSSNDLNWSFGQSLFFSSTVATTIGYGHVTPLSQTGKIFCMIYATFGIPLTLILLSACVEKLLIPANWFLGLLNSKFGHLYQPFNIRLFHLIVIGLIILIIFFAIPTVVFSALEPDWNALDAFYYCFISLTTIGLGDYIPGEEPSENRLIYKICITIYLILGLISMMLALTIFYEIPQLNYLGQLFTENSNSSNETDKLRLSGKSPAFYSDPSSSTAQLCTKDDEIRRVKIRPHFSPSPDEEPSNSFQ